MQLQMPKGSDEIGHGGTKYVVNNHTWQVTVPDAVGHVLLATGSGAVRLPDIEPGPIQCPHCGHTFKGTDAV